MASRQARPARKAAPRGRTTRRSPARRRPAAPRRSASRWAPWVARLRRRLGAAVGSGLFVLAGLLYFFRWAPLDAHQSSVWLSPDDLWGTFSAAIAFVHGHFGSIYAVKTGFLSFPGILVVLAPLAALSGSLQETLIKVATHHHHLAHPVVLFVQGSPLLHTEMLPSAGSQYVVHPDIWLWLAPYVLVVSCPVLFAADALAERLGAGAGRRLLLGVAEAVLLWNVTVLWGHPEDALALAFALYALVLALDGRWRGAGWLMGVGIACQPLVVVVVPVLVAMKGRQGAFAFLGRALSPAVVLALPPAVADVHATAHALISQPALPRRNHTTPWTSLAPKLGGHGVNQTVGGGVVRSAALVLAVVVGWWSRRWRSRPEMLLWAFALALALRCYAESVMTSYYVWPALAVGLVVVASARREAFGATAVAAVLTTVVAQWHLGKWPWWSLDIGGLTVVLALAAWSAARASEPTASTPPPVAASPRPARAAARR